MARPEEKRAQLEDWLKRGSVLVHLDARKPGVQIPPLLLGRTRLGLSFSSEFSPRDLTVTDWGLAQTLSFNGHQFRCRIPWDAIYALIQGDDEAAWYEDMPGREEPDNRRVTSHLQLVA